MSGFLQRLALGAMGPAPGKHSGIRPVLQPLFAEPRIEPLPAGQAMAEPLAPRDVHAESRHQTSPSVSSRVTGEPHSRHEIADVLMPAAPVEANSFELLLPKISSPQAPVPATVAESDAPAPPGTPGRTVNPFAAAVDAGLNPETRQAPSASAQGPAPLIPVRAAAPASNVAQQRAPVPQQRTEPDEIRIQIGRIEVIAVPPSVPQACSRRFERPCAKRSTSMNISSAVDEALL